MSSEDLITHVRALSEIELLGFMEQLGSHLSKNKMEHLIDQVFEVGSDELDEMQDQVNNLEDEISSLEEQIDDYKLNIKVAAEKFEEIKKILS